MPRGEWWCPDCKERASKKKSAKLAVTVSQRVSGRAKQQPNSRIVVVDESNYIFEPKAKALRGTLTTSSLVKVDAAERQSRKAMEDLLIDARLLRFCNIGRAIPPEHSTSLFPHGLGKFSLTDKELRNMQSLHRVIVKRLAGGNRLTPWAGVSESDARKRGYAFLPSTFGHFGKSALQSAGVHFHAAEKSAYAAKKDENANWNSCFRLSQSDITETQVNVLRSLITKVRTIVPAKYQSCVCLEQLQALQPNLHNGLDHLPGLLLIYQELA